LQLVHEVVDHNSAAHLDRLRFFGHCLAEHHVSELLYHEKLLQDRVDVAGRTQVLNAHEALPDQALLRWQDCRQHSLKIGVTDLASLPRYQLEYQSSVLLGKGTREQLLQHFLNFWRGKALS
jgi:hypothetical protein